MSYSLRPVIKRKEKTSFRLNNLDNISEVHAEMIKSSQSNKDYYEWFDRYFKNRAIRSELFTEPDDYTFRYLYQLFCLIKGGTKTPYQMEFINKWTYYFESGGDYTTNFTFTLVDMNDDPMDSDYFP